jgi:hypothetical protein
MRRPAATVVLVSALLVAVGAAVSIGFVGAANGEQFDWQLCAEIGTAAGTILLAAYTAWLAATTRREVGLAIEEQRARDRPIVVGWPVEITRVSLDPQFGETAAAARVRLRNVGLGPALDLEVAVSPRLLSDEVSRLEVVAVLAVDEEREVFVSLTNMPEPEGGFRIESFVVKGRYRDRTRTSWEPIVGLAERGIRDEQLAAQRIADVRAALWFTPGAQREESDATVVYAASVGNNGRGTARGVTILVTNEDGFATEPIEVGDIPGNTGSVETLISLSRDHGPVTCTLQWTDGTGPQEAVFERQYP